jgi:UDPglucose--hexose-1-phosphate uridylyltransferase
MSQLRHDRLSGCDVIVAAARAGRPTTFRVERDTDAAGADCPFCPGNEHRTPPEIARAGLGEPGGTGWQVRTFPNLYPIVETHEVVVLAPDHRSFGELDDDEAVAVVTMLHDRVGAHLEAGAPYGVAIVNHRRAAGASIAHPHAQVFALDTVPRPVEAMVARVRDAGTDLVHDDASTPELVVTRRDGVVTWCPPASTSPYFLRIAHDDAGPRFDRSPSSVTDGVALALRDALRRLRTVLDDAPYNVVLRTAPATGASGDAASYHWYLDVIPRLSVVAGFEQATGILVNVVPPEQAAALLRGES